MPKDEAEMTAIDVIEMVRLLDQYRIDVWIDGGWGDAPRPRALLESKGFKGAPRDDTRD